MRVAFNAGFCCRKGMLVFDVPESTSLFLFIPKLNDKEEHV
jgi:hypothetical protein